MGRMAGQFNSWGLGGPTAGRQSPRQKRARPRWGLGGGRLNLDHSSIDQPSFGAHLIKLELPRNPRSENSETSGSNLPTSNRISEIEEQYWYTHQQKLRRATNIFAMAAGARLFRAELV